MRRGLSAILAACLVLSAASPAAADSESDPVAVEADLDGLPINVADIPSHFCHDRAFPKVHCFGTARDLERALVASSSGLTVQAAASADYVVVYAGTTYNGAAMYLSQDYDTLAVIGWNDRIRSYKGLNSGRGVFYIDWFALGGSMTFCCNVLDPSLPAAFDRQITSVYRQ